MYSEILIYVVVGLLFIGGGLTTARLIRPHRPNVEKSSTYESGEEPTGSAYSSFPVKYYIIALIFLLFEVEVIFLFPWAVVFSDEEVNNATNNYWGWLAMAEVFFFLFILITGLVYAWKKGYLDWDKTQMQENKYKGPVPEELYQKFNDNVK